MRSPWGIGALCVAFTAGISLTLVVIDSNGSAEGAQTVEAGAAQQPLRPDTEASSPAVVGELDPLVVNARVGIDGVELRSRIGAAPRGIGPADTATAADGGVVAGGADATPADGATGTAAAPLQVDTGAAGASARTGGATGNIGGGGSTPAAAPPSSAPSPGAGSSTSPSTSSAPTTGPPTTAAAPTTAPPTTAPPTTATPGTPVPNTGRGSETQFDSIRNRDAKFNRFADRPESQIPLDALTEPSRPDNGSVGDGQFRMYCDYSHFSYDDPIVYPGQPGRAHLHMFFGNTATNAFSTTESLVNSGGGSCQGFELNRSGYWTPAVLDGRGNAVVPDQIVLYYKSKQPGNVQPPPQGLQMLAGDPTKESFNVSQQLGWSCGGSGTSNNKSNRIPNCGGDRVNFWVQFPNCWDGRNLSSADKRSHVRWVAEESNCPSSHPVRMPQITILAYFPAGADTSGWYLSSDRSGGFNTGPGATLHADWFGAWNDEALNLWMNGCMRAARNCSEGQTGTPRKFANLSGGNIYQGPNYLPLPG